MYIVPSLKLHFFGFFFKYIVKYSSWAAPKFQWKKIRTELFSHPYLYSFLHQSDSFFGLKSSFPIILTNVGTIFWQLFQHFGLIGAIAGSSSVDVIVLFTMLQTDSKMWHTALKWRSMYIWYWLNCKKWANPSDRIEIK